MVRRKKMSQLAKPNAEAKHVRMEERHEFVAASFRNKIKQMHVILNSWRTDGRPVNAFWPNTKVALREWHDPKNGIFRWGSPNVDTPAGPHGELVQEWVFLVREAAKVSIGMSDVKMENARLKAVNRKLAEQLATRTWQVTELLDALSILDNTHHLLSLYRLDL